ncbi:MAG: RNA polymerase sigma factor [Planctomycetota bacterium]
MTDWDSALLERLKGGDHAAFERLVDDYAGPLFRFFVCDHGNHHLAEDQSAETFAQLVRSIPSMRGDAERLPAFVFTIARRIKQRDWRKRTMPTDLIDAAHGVPDTGPSPEARLEAREQVAAAMMAIGSLKQNAREAMLLHYVEGYSIALVSEVLGERTGTVKSLLHRARHQLRHELKTTEAQT